MLDSVPSGFCCFFWLQVEVCSAIVPSKKTKQKTITLVGSIRVHCKIGHEFIDSVKMENDSDYV